MSACEQVTAQATSATYALGLVHRVDLSDGVAVIVAVVRARIAAAERCSWPRGVAPVDGGQVRLQLARSMLLLRLTRQRLEERTRG